MEIDDKYIPLLDEMLYELYENRLTVELVPDEIDSEKDNKIRAVSAKNPDWYQEFCSRYPSTRIRKKELFDTKIKRKYTIQLLERMIKNGRSNSVYAEDLLEVAKARYETWEAIRKADEVPWDNQF